MCTQGELEEAGRRRKAIVVQNPLERDQPVITVQPYRALTVALPDNHMSLCKYWQHDVTSL